ncbi:MAG TPA: hypothetical protein VF478_10415 [Anaerolineae bacterium]
MKALQFAKTIFLGSAICLGLSIVSSVGAAAPTGSSPNDPLMVPTKAQTIAPNTTVWFYFDYPVGTKAGGPGGGPGGGGGPRGGPGSSSGQEKVSVTVDANGNQGLQLAVYTPEQAANWVGDPSATPVGRGTPYTDTSNDQVVHDLYWSGGFNASGRYQVAVTNNSASGISFTMTVTGETVTLYPAAAAAATPTLYVPITVTPVPTATITGKIVFETATGGDIYTVNGDGSNLTRVSRGIDPAWSPDGTQITFARWDNAAPGVYVANADGSNERLIFSAPRIRWPRWSPDGKYIVFSQDKSKSDNNTIWKLGLVDVATGKLTEPQCSQLCFVPSWGKDSTTIVYTDPNVAIMSTSILGGPASLVLRPKGSYLDSGANIWRPIEHMPTIQNSELSPDGKSIVYAQQAADRWEVNLVSADGGSTAAVTSPDPILSFLFDKVVHNTAPIWSTDSQLILFLSDRNGKWEFFVSDPSGANVRQVLKNVTDQVTVKFTYENERMMDWTRR